MPAIDKDEALLEEREWLCDLLDEFDDLDITDRGLGMGQADLVYERSIGDKGETRRVEISIKEIKDRS